MSFFEDLASTLSTNVTPTDSGAGLPQGGGSTTSQTQEAPQQEVHGESSGGGSETFLWKPTSDADGNLVLLLPASVNASSVQLVDSNGRVIDQGSYRRRTNGNRQTFNFSRPGGAYSGVTVVVDGKPITNVGNGASRYETGGLSSFGQGSTPAGGFNTTTDQFGNTTVMPNDFNPYTGMGFNQLNAPDIPTSMAEFINPLLSAGLTAEYNKQQFGQIVEGALELAPALAGALNEQNTATARQTQAFQQEQVGDANAYNQQALTTKVDEQLPGFRRDTAQDMETARTLASGDLPDFIDERVIQGGVRNSATDSASFGGFGAGSVFGRNTADRLDAQNRLGLVEQGINLTDRIANRAFGTFIDAPIKASPVVPNPIMASEMFNNIANVLTPLSTISPSGALSSSTQQGQFNAGQSQATNFQNASNQMATDKFNTEQQLAIDNAVANQAVFNQAQQFNALQNSFNSTTNSQMQADQLEALQAQQDSVNSSNQTNSAIALGTRAVGSLFGNSSMGSTTGGLLGGGGIFGTGLGNGVLDSGLENYLFGSESDQVADLFGGGSGTGGLFGTINNGVSDNWLETGFDSFMSWFS